MTPLKATNYRSTAAFPPLLHDPFGLEALLDGVLHPRRGLGRPLLAERYGVLHQRRHDGKTLLPKRALVKRDESPDVFGRQVLRVERDHLRLQALGRLESVLE